MTNAREASGIKTSRRKATARWKGQRTSAAALISLTIWFLIEMLRHNPADYFLILAWTSQPWVGGILALFTGMLFYHSAVGLRVIVEDYVPHPLWQKILVHLAQILNLGMAFLSWYFILYIVIMGNE